MRSKIFPSGIRRKWFRSVAIMCIIPFMLGIIVCFSSVFSYRKQMEKNSDVMLTQIRSLEDQALNDIRLIMENVRQSEVLEYLSLHGSTPNNAENIMYKRRLQQQLNSYETYNVYIDSIYVYFWKSDEFVTSDTAAGSALLFNAYHNVGQLTYDDWMQSIRSFHKGEALLMPISDSNTGNVSGNWSQRLAYMKTYPWFETNDCRATIIILVDSEAIRSMSRNLADNSPSSYDMLVGGRLLLSGDVLSYKNTPRYDDGFYRATLSDDDIATLMPSQEFPSIYHVLLSSPQKISVMTLGIFWLFLAGLALMIVLTVLMGHLFVRSNYKPIAEIMDEIPLQAKNAGAEGSEEANEFTTIRSSIVRARLQQASLQEQLVNRDNLLSEETLLLLLTGNVLSDSQILLIKQVLPYARYSVVLIEPAKNAEDGSTMPLSTEQLEDIETNLRAYLQSHLVTYSWRIVPVGSQTAIVLNDPDIGESKSGGICQYLTDTLKEDYPDLPVLLSYSTGRTDIDLLSVCYEEAYYTMEYQRIFGVDFRAVHEKRQQGWVMPEYKFDRQDEERLSTFITKGDSQHSVAFLRELWNINIERKISHAMLHCFLFNVAGTLLRVCNVITPATDILPDLNDMVQQLSQGSQELTACFATVCHFTETVCMHYGMEYQQTNVVLKDQVLAYIEEHCGDSNLSVESISDAFGKSRSYLFTLFKESTGNSILYHINSARMKKAKKLLLDNRLSVREVAESCGFNSTANFTRVFKKYEGVQPSEYRTRRRL